MKVLIIKRGAAGDVVRTTDSIKAARWLQEFFSTVAMPVRYAGPLASKRYLK
jgi:hypothetical protein